MTALFEDLPRLVRHSDASLWLGPIFRGADLVVKRFQCRLRYQDIVQHRQIGPSPLSRLSLLLQIQSLLLLLCFRHAQSPGVIVRKCFHHGIARMIKLFSSGIVDIRTGENPIYRSFTLAIVPSEPHRVWAASPAEEDPFQ